MRTRNILYELKDQLRNGTIESQVNWCHDPLVQMWAKRYYVLWNKVVTEIPNASRKKITGNTNRKKNLPGPPQASLR